MSASAVSEVIAQCPANIAQGFLQKTGQCWNDSIIIALIYGCRNEIQHKLLNMGAEIIVNNAVKYNSNMMPINIEPSDMEVFESGSKKHIKYIIDRLINSKHKIPRTK